MRIHALVVSCLLYACSSESTESGPLSPAPPESGEQLATETYRLAPGEEKYMCYQFYSPATAVAITRVDQISAPGIHHFGLFQAFGRNEPDAPHECNTLIKQTWLPIWGANTGEHKLVLPEGTGFVIEPGTQYIIQLHLQNATDRTMEIRGGLNLTYEHDVSRVIPAGMFALGSFALEIPAHTPTMEVPVTCQPGKEMNVFGVLPHMHKYGTAIELTRTPAAAAPQMLYKIDPWVFGDQPLEMLSTKIASDETLDLTCRYKNESGNAIKYGESSDDEMCFFVLFYYPYDHLDGCILN